ncbi:MAG TPA: hypothetical protein VFN56_00980 [Candidatus Saccharimonadales bacterium]|nr:hypothetical protein [Candidatus Saccharimonadales bacterium]
MAPEIVPVIAGLVGGGVGAYYEHHAQNAAAQNQQPIAAALAKTALHSVEAPHIENQSTFTRVKRWMGHHAVAVVAMPALAAGTFAGLAYEQSAASDSIPASLEIVVDHSGATSLPPAGQPNAQPIVNEINTVANQFAHVGGIKPEVLVSGHNQDAIKMSLSEMLADQPFGQSHMDQATLSALSQTANVLPLSDGHHLSRNAALFVITNGNEIGVPNDVVQASKDQDKTPIYVVNVEGDSSATTVKDLQSIARRTGGMYWNVTQASVDNAAVSVKKTVSSYSRPNSNIELTAVYSALSAVFAAGAGMAYRIRKRMPINKGFDRNLGR